MSFKLKKKHKQPNESRLYKWVFFWIQFSAYGGIAGYKTARDKVPGYKGNITLY